MPENKKIDDIPEHFANIEEASDFWDTHDAGDYERYLCPVNEDLYVAKELPQAVLLEYSPLEKLKKIARQRDAKIYYNDKEMLKYIIIILMKYGRICAK